MNTVSKVEYISAIGKESWVTVKFESSNVIYKNLQRNEKCKALCNFDNFGQKNKVLQIDGSC